VIQLNASVAIVIIIKTEATLLNDLRHLT